LAAGLEPVELLVAGENVAPEVLASVSGLPHPARQIAVFRHEDLPRLDPGAAPSVGLALWHVGDPGTVGTILRCADALGPAYVALSAGCADPTGPKSLRASMGAVFRVAVGAFEDAPGRRVALVARGGEPLDGADLSGPVTFVLGAEREGLPESVTRSAALRVSIPVEPGAESLNVAAAAAIALYERRRGHG
jgi:TrmH family RNA methyltransferase